MSAELAPKNEVSLAPVARVTVSEVQAELVRARERAKAQLAAFEARLGELGRWREVARRRPLLAIGGAFLLGYTVAKLFTRRR